ncbi:hypothetical protein QYE76_032877 [Lolium multiflorum]|uniref:CCHC-type domain-containing protein n=1 Tax=Lolium multiflorum TaxID=4521 RepID=A0AAD8QWF0_LOLMU|nr:hypothetical protein QYE76_032877 [Lolium multiflorum]
MMTWEDFKLKFSKYHVPQGLIKKMRDEFRELKQRRMSVVEYRDSFSLSSYTMEGKSHRANENRKLNDETSGPHHTLSTAITPLEDSPQTKSHLLDLSPQLQQQQRRTPKPGGNNNNNNNHNSHNNNGNNTNTNTGLRTGSNAIPVTPKDKSTVNCYECGVVGHYSKECPKKLAKIAANTAAPEQPGL